MLKTHLTKELSEIREHKVKKKKSSKKKSLSAKHKQQTEPKNLKLEENLEFKLNNTKKPPLFKKQSLPNCKISCISPKRSAKCTKKKPILQNIPTSVHNSDTEKSTKRIDKNRAQSNLENSLKSKLELSQKVFDPKNTSPCRIDDIIKSTLVKVKKQKGIREKKAKHKVTMNEIKKMEQEHQNNLIRHLNFQKNKKKKITPQGTQVISKSKKEKLIQMILGNKGKKLKYRSISSRRSGRYKSKTMKNMRSNSVGKEYFTTEFRPYEGNIIGHRDNFERMGLNKISTYRESSNVIENEYSDTERLENQKNIRNTRVKVKRNISLIDTGELANYLEPYTIDNPCYKRPRNYKYEFEDHNSDNFSSLEDLPDMKFQKKNSGQMNSDESKNEPNHEEPLEKPCGLSREGRSRNLEIVNKAESKTEEQKVYTKDQTISLKLFNTPDIPENNSTSSLIEKNINFNNISPSPEPIPESNLQLKNPKTEEKTAPPAKTKQILHQNSKSQQHYAATTIQRAFRQHIQNRSKDQNSQVSHSTYQNIIIDQIGWRKAQLLSLEYLKEKELEDLQSLAELIGHNSQLEELLSKTVSQRYEQFAKVFKENIDNIETAIIEKMDTCKIIEYSNKIKDKKDAINKIIEENNLNSTLPKQELEILLKETNAMINKDFEGESPFPTTSTLSQTNFGLCENTMNQQEKHKKNMEIHIEENDINIEPIKKIKVEEKSCEKDKKKINNCIWKKIKERKEEIILEEKVEMKIDSCDSGNVKEDDRENIEENKKPEKIEKTIQVITETKETKLQTISIHEISNIDATMLSPIFPETITFPTIPPNTKHFHNNEGSTSPLPARPSAPLMFLDVDDCNISLESLLNSSTPNHNKQPLPGLPLLNLGNLPPNINPIISSDPRIETNPNFIKSFVKQVFSSIDLLSLQSEIKQGIIKNPLEILSQVHELDLGNVVDKGTYPSILNIPTIIENLFDSLNNDCITETQTTQFSLLSTQRFINKADRIHKIMILTVADELLQKHRPYGTRGIPMAWSEVTRVFIGQNKIMSEIIDEVIDEIEELARCEVGKIATEEMILSNGNLDEELLQEIREETISYAIRKEVSDNEWIWTDYEFEETQVKMDLADMILSELAGEIIELGI
ncbi:hypothetical protein SteCoe_30560 [Stentor coeruleus]|uniref:DUF4378 domain-containing protein n=1 Tax=Stentor coeruleus TaxID=5963 RepID=A0A1R2B3C6_9CILI|nr:hypothetical protein SteCoe_30560 [Stentor coeruleus]